METLKLFGIGPRAARNKAGLLILIAAVALGLAGDLLLRAWPWGLNAAIWLAALSAAALVLPRLHTTSFATPRRVYWLWTALGFSLLLVWRSSPVLQTLNVIAVFFCLAMVAFPSNRAFYRARSTEFIASVAVSAVQAVVGAIVLVARHLDWRALAGPERSARFAALGRGLAIAALPVIVFAALFASADVFFRDLLREIIFFDLAYALSHAGLFILFAWLAASCLWGALLAEREPVPEVPRPGVPRFAFIEVGIVFGLVDALFLAFVGVQFRYLFGGAGRVESSSSLTYAEYARRGFFELVAVAALVALFLLITHWLLPRGYARLHRFFAAVAGLLIVLAFVVMASALERMRLYQEAYGLTELRLYTTAFMGWLCVVLIWLAVTVLRNRRDLFPFGITIAGLAILVVLNALNPDGFILQRNASIADDAGARPFDSEYALNLSPDAVPTLVANLDKVEPAERCSVGRALERRYGERDDDWRSWTWGRFRAHRAVSSSTKLTSTCTIR